MGRKSETPPPPKKDSVAPDRSSSIPPDAPNRDSSMPPKVSNKLRLVKLMIGRNRRKLMAGRVLPIADKETKESVKFGNEEYYEKLEAMAERDKKKREVYERLPKEERKKHPELKPEGCEDDHELWELLRGFFESSTGKSIEELQALSFEDTREIDSLAAKIENEIVNNVPFLSGSTHEERRNQLREFSKDANDFHRHCTKFLPEHAQSLRWGTTLTNADNNVGQLALKFIVSDNPRVRHHAKLKLLLMLHLGFITDHRSKGVGFEESLSFLTNFIIRSVVHYKQGDERGSATTKLLRTSHTSSVKKTKDTFSIYDAEGEIRLADDERVQKIEVRKAVVKNNAEEERIIEFVIDSRPKDDNSLAEKGLRDGNTSIKDHHGAKFIFSTRDDAMDFEKLLIESLQKEYSEVLILEYGKLKQRETSAEQSYDKYSKRLGEIMENREENEMGDEEARKVERLVQKMEVAKNMKEESIEEQNKIMDMLGEKDKCIFIEGKCELQDEGGKAIVNEKGEPVTKKVKGYDVEEVLEQVTDNIDRGQRKGGSKGGSEKFKVRKYYIDYKYPEYKSEKIMPFEWQFQVYDGYVDTQVRHDVNEEEFHINRVFDDGIMELIAPPEVYPEIDLAKAKRDRIKEIRNRVEDALTHTVKGKRGLRKKRKKSGG